jgi:glycosyltransferase involved in cell wall biosynthesis
VPEPVDQRQGEDVPKLSVILVVGSQRERAARALCSLLEQNIINQIEILLFDLGPEECSALPQSDHPRVRLTRQSPKDLLAAARVHGIHAAKAPVVCFMEEHCEMQPGWAEAIALAHRGPWAGVGGDFINGNPGAGKSDQAFRMNYGIYVHPHRGRGPTKTIAGQNCSFKRDVMLRYDENLELMLNADLVLQWKMAEDGHQLFYEPTAKIAHRNENTFRSLCVGVFYWNWCFSNVRARVFKWSLAHKILWIALAPLIPWVRLAKMFVWVSRLGRSQFVSFLHDIPFIVAVNHWTAAGQVAGLLNKIDTAAREFSHFEANEPRLLRAEFTR